MIFDEGSQFRSSGVVVAAKTYTKAITIITAMWERVFGERLEVVGASPTERFFFVVERLETQLGNNQKRAAIACELDVDPASTAEQIVRHVVDAASDLRRVSSMDDLTPNQIKQAMMDVAWELGEDDAQVDVGLPQFLRGTLDVMFERASLSGRINVGANRHFSRLLQWLRECEAETEWGDGQGIRIKNASGRGKVAQHPQDPKGLKITINRAYL